MKLVQIDREAVRAVVSPGAFEEIERLRHEGMPGEQEDEVFWRLAREQMVSSARQQPDFAVKIMKAKVGGVGAMLGLQPEQIARLVRQVDHPKFGAAAVANLSIQAFQREAQFQHLWTEQGIRANPPVRVEFEHATVFACINDAGNIAKSKNWGLLTEIQPLRVEDRLLPTNITYVLKPTSKLRMRWEFRDTFKGILRNRSGLVAEALRSTKKSFLKNLKADDARVIRSRLDLMPSDFWRMVRHGEEFGPDGIAAFVRTLEEKTKGYALPFSQPEQGLVQIQPASPFQQEEIA